MTRIADAIIVLMSWLLAYPIRFDLVRKISFLPLAPGRPATHYYLALLPLIFILWITGFQAFGVYRYDKVIRRSTEIYTFLRAHLAILILFTALTFFVTDFRFSRGVIIIFGLLVFSFGWLFRVLTRKLLRELNRKGIHSLKLVAVGEGKELDFLLSQLRRYPELGI